MRSNKSKVILIVTIVLLILILAVGGVGAYLYLKTDIFKSNKELFSKYIGQTTEQIEKVFETEKISEITKKLEEKNSESKTVLTFENEGNEALNKMSLSMDIKNDVTNKQMYNDVKLLNGEESLIEVEYMSTEDAISLRLTDIVKQFLTIDRTNLEQLATSLNMEVENLESILESLKYKNSDSSIILTSEELKTLKQTYVDIINANLKNSDFSKQTDVMITINGKTVTANSYILTIKPEQYKSILQKVMEQLKNDTIIVSKLEAIDIANMSGDENSLKQIYINKIDEMLQQLETTEYKDNLIVTVYEQEGKTLRVKVEEGFYTITIDTIENDEILGVNIKLVSLENQIENAIEVNLTKYKTEYYNLSIELKSIAIEEKSVIFEIKAVNNEQNMQLEFGITSIENQISTKAVLTSNIQFVEEIADMIILVENTNNITLNNLTAEKCNQIIQTVVNSATKKYQEIITDTMEILTQFTTVSEETETPGIPDNDVTNTLKEAEITSFNSKFEQYEGDDITGSAVNTLIRIVLDNNTEQKEQDKKVEITGTVELKTTDKEIPENGANVGKTYKVVFNYDDETGFINTINITEN